MYIVLNWGEPDEPHIVVISITFSCPTIIRLTSVQLSVR